MTQFIELHPPLYKHRRSWMCSFFQVPTTLPASTSKDYQNDKSSKQVGPTTFHCWHMPPHTVPPSVGRAGLCGNHREHFLTWSFQWLLFLLLVEPPEQKCSVASRAEAISPVETWITSPSETHQPNQVVTRPRRTLCPDPSWSLSDTSHAFASLSSHFPYFPLHGTH